jgi:hypothetical protein
MALDMLRPDVKPPFPADTLANFRRGRDRERDIVSDLTRVGRFCEPAFEIVGGQERFELRDRKGRVVIVGKTDFRIKFAGQKGSEPAELKSWHPNLVQGIKSFGDLFNNRWTRKGGFQLLAYLLGSNQERGWFFLDRPGIPRPLEVRLLDWLPMIEDFLQRAEVAMESREKIAKSGFQPEHEIAELGSGSFWNYHLPPFIDDPAECRVCPFFGSACNPPLSYEGASIITDEEVLAKIEQHEALDEPRTTYRDVHEEIADLLKRSTPKENAGKNKRQIIAGRYLIECSWGKNTTLDMPDAEKRKWQKIDEAGKFSFKITKVGE